MSLYIHPKNQELLWDIINKNNIIQQYFSYYQPGTKEAWFRQIISSFYEQNKNILVSNDQLYEINKNTIQYMIQDVKRNMNYQQSMQQPNLQNSQYDSRTQSIDPLRPYSVTENKEDKMAAQYNQYQQNYMSMLDKKVPDSIDFRENISEGAINNMDELIKRHLQERDEELKKYAPQPLFGNQPQNVQPQNTTNRITIDKSSEPIKFSIEELDNSPNISQKIIESREPIIKDKIESSVKWLDNENSNKIDELRKDFLEFQHQIMDMFQNILDKNGEPMYIGDFYSFSTPNNIK